MTMNVSGMKFARALTPARAVPEQVLRIQIGDEAEDISIPPDGKTLAACLEQENTVSCADLTTFKSMHTVETQGKNPEHCIFSPDGKKTLCS